MSGLPHSITPCPILVMPSTRLGCDKYQLFFVIIGLTRPGFKPIRSGFPPLQNGRWVLYPFDHPVWCTSRTLSRTDMSMTYLCYFCRKKKVIHINKHKTPRTPMSLIAALSLESYTVWSRCTCSMMHLPQAKADCWSFASWQHLRSCQDGYPLVTVCTHGDVL